MMTSMNTLTGVASPQVQPPRVVRTRFLACRPSGRPTSQLVAGRACLTCGWSATAPEAHGQPQDVLFGAEHLRHTEQQCAERQRQRWADHSHDTSC